MAAACLGRGLRAKQGLLGRLFFHIPNDGPIAGLGLGGPILPGCVLRALATALVLRGSANHPSSCRATREANWRRAREILDITVPTGADVICAISR